jgi:cyclophilin family peptidyl-prolyl cis-trans isomerase
MNRKLFSLLSSVVLMFTASCSSPAAEENIIVLMKTSMGDIKLKLYNETPLHRDNFVKHVKSGFYEGISFHRVINSFMIQAGDPVTRSVPIDKSADSLNTYTVPAEFRKDLFHKKGALAAAREGNDVNPEMRSSGTHFYIVQGTVLTDEDLVLAEQRINTNIKQALFNKIIRQISDSARVAGSAITEAEIQEKASDRMFEFLASNPQYVIPASQKEVYKTIGGVPRLDGTYTVFGEVLEGLDVVDKIAAVKTDPGDDRPLVDVKILKIKFVK